MQLREYVERQRKAKAMKPSKYRNKPTTVDGIRFASKAEALRWKQLKMLQDNGRIFGLTRQARHELKVGDNLIATYVSDFVYATGSGRVVVEDTKGALTDVCRMKLKLMEACHGVKVQLLTKKTNPELFR